MNRFARFLSVLSLLTGFCFVSAATIAEEPAVSQPATTGDGSLVYEVTDVGGRVKVSASGTDPLSDTGWTPVQKGDFIRAGQQIHVPIRARLKLAARPAEPPTVIYIDSSTLVNISELSLQDGAAKSRIQIAHGLIKAGVAEGEVRSDMEIEAPTATLSKKGTDIFSFDVHPDGRFYMGLSAQGRGLVQGFLNQSSGLGASQMRSRFLTPGQWITQQMARAIDNVQFDRKVLVNDVYGLQGADQLFALFNDHGGISFLLPAGNNAYGYFGGNLLEGRGLPGQNQAGLSQNVAGFLNQGGQGAPNNNGGDFGIGQGQVPGVFESARGVQSARACTDVSKMAMQRGGGRR